MLTQTKPHRMRVALHTGQITHMQEAAETICHDAISHARAQMPVRLRAASLPELLQNPFFVNNFKAGLARGAANVIIANDGQIQSIYLFEDAANPDAATEEHLPFDYSIHLILVVSSKSAALNAFVDALDRTLTGCVRELPLAQLANWASILDVIPLTEAEVASRRGHAALLHSMFAPATRLWAREQ